MRGFKPFFETNKEIVNPLYLYYYFSSLSVVKYINNIAIGAAVPGINLGLLKRLPISLPPKKTQDKVADILDTYSTLIDNNNQRIQLLEEMAEEIYKEWFVRLRFPGYQTATFLDKSSKSVPHGTEGALPEGWEKVKLNTLTSYIGRGISPSYVEEKGVTVINQKCIRDHKVNLEPARLSSPQKKIPKEKILKPFDILINSTGTGTLGRVAQIIDVNDIITVDTHVTIVRTKEDLSKIFLGRAIEFQEVFIENLGKGSTNQIELSRLDLAERLRIILPHKNIQNDFEEKVLPLLKLSANLLKKNKILQETRDLLLPRLISGKFSVEELDIATVEAS